MSRIAHTGASGDTIPINGRARFAGEQDLHSVNAGRLNDRNLVDFQNLSNSIEAAGAAHTGLPHLNRPFPMSDLEDVHPPTMTRKVDLRQ